LLEIKNVTKQYGKHIAVSDLSFTVEEHGIYGFLGPNGAGKSTTMNIITGYIGANDGTVMVNGFDMLRQPAKAKKCIGYLPEIPPLYTDMTVYEYLKFSADLKKLSKDKKEDYIYDAMALAGVDDVEDRLIKNLSKGYKQRVGLAQAVLGFPEIIILDEPTVGLDPKQIIEIREVIKELGKDHTVILSSHILSEVREVCDYIYIIANGKLVAADTTENIEKMAGNPRIALSVKGDIESLNEVLDSIPEIPTYEVTVDGDIVNAIIYLDGGEEYDNFVGVDRDNLIGDSTKLRERLFFALAEKSMPILRMNPETDSLEDVFIRLTSVENDAEDEYTDEYIDDEDDFSDVEEVKQEVTVNDNDL